MNSIYRLDRPLHRLSPTKLDVCWPYDLDKNVLDREETPHDGRF